MPSSAEKPTIAPEIRLLFEKRASIKRELDKIDRDIERNLGVHVEARPQKPRMSAKEFQRRCGQ